MLRLKPGTDNPVIHILRLDPRRPATGNPGFWESYGYHNYGDPLLPVRT
jgi:hypothetical protein